MRARSFAAIVGLAGFATLAACALTSDLDGLTGGSPSAPVEAGVPQTGTVDAAPGMSPPEAGPTPPKCQGTSGPTPVQVPGSGFCIDATEVTNAQYRAFRAARDGIFDHQPAGCAWNTTWQPTIRSGADVDPVFGTNWCQAYAYCAWAGKRLCGLVGGHGAGAPSVQVNSVDDEWFRACSANGTQGYPYGKDYDAGLCNAFNTQPGPWAVGSHPGCQGGYPGIFDLDGNMWEWEASCDTTPEAGDAGTGCIIRGGSYAASNDGSCYIISGISRDQASRTVNDVGIRCCSDFE